MCPNINLLRSYKVYPSKVDFKYQKYQFFIYMYLNPFKEYITPVSYKAGDPKIEYCFAYEPIYLGKGTGAGYRHNQHLKAYLRDHEGNQFKIQTFKKIQDQMAEAAAKQDTSKPWNWEEYKQSWVKIIQTFDDPRALLKFEMELINQIGTQFDRTGPLANKIKNAYKFDRLSQGQAPIF